VVHGFVLVPGPASDCESFAAYASSPEFAQYRCRVRRPGDVEGQGAARGLHIQTHGGAGGVPGAVVALGQLLGFGCRGARRPARASRVRRDRSFARSPVRAAQRLPIVDSLGIPRALRAASCGAARTAARKMAPGASRYIAGAAQAIAADFAHEC
jgi:hypothetical protein